MLERVEVPVGSVGIGLEDCRYRVSVSGINHYSHDGATQQRRAMVSGIGSHDNKDVLITPSSKKVRDSIQLLFSGIIWDIPL